MIVGGSGQDYIYAKYLYEYLSFYARGFGEICVFIADIDPEQLREGELYDVEPRVQQIINRLNRGDLTNITIIGFSEGAAATGTFLSRLADNPNLISADVRRELKVAILLECPTGASSLAVLNYDSSCLNNLPQRLADAGINIRLADIWNRASIIHASGTLPGWEESSRSYDSRPWYEQAFTYLHPAGFAYRLANESRYHNSILNNEYALTVMHSVISGN